MKILFRTDVSWSLLSNLSNNKPVQLTFYFPMYADQAIIWSDKQCLQKILGTSCVWWHMPVISGWNRKIIMGLRATWATEWDLVHSAANSIRYKAQLFTNCFAVLYYSFPSPQPVVQPSLPLTLWSDLDFTWDPLRTSHMLGSPQIPGA